LFTCDWPDVSAVVACRLVAAMPGCASSAFTWKWGFNRALKTQKGFQYGP
jgi:hypothetical protein